MKNSITIKTISIKNFRSIRNIKIDVDDLNIFVGLNDIGKSNLLKALNLFFNEQTDYHHRFDFDVDFSYLFPTTSHGTKEIVISIIFEMPETFKGERLYKWEKSWRYDGLKTDKIKTLDGKEPPKKSRIDSAIRRIKYRYVPAVKSKEYFKGLLAELYLALASSLTSPLQKSIDDFSNILSEYTNSINEGVRGKLNINSTLTFPNNLENVFSALIFKTKSDSDNLDIDLNYRGDGIQARHIPIILKYIADEDQKSRSGSSTRISTVWGFEEPENGLELSKAFDLAAEFKDYSNDIQLFITSHSPAFYMLKSKWAKVFYAEKDEATKGTVYKKDVDSKELCNDMGLMPLVAPFIAEKELEIKQLKQEYTVDLINKKVIVVEGITDQYYIEKAIELYSPALQQLLNKNELVIYTKPEDGGTDNLERILKSFVIGINKKTKIGLIDKDDAGLKAKSNINSFKDMHNKSSLVSVLELQPNDNIKEIYKLGYSNFTYCIEHLLRHDLIDKLIEKKKLVNREPIELQNILGGKISIDKSILQLINELEDNKIKNLILYKPGCYYKSDIKKEVEKIFKLDPKSNVLEGLVPTIKVLEDKLSK